MEEPTVIDGETHRVFLSLGSNLGDRVAYLRQAIMTLPGVVAVSPLYETEPVGGPEEQPEYLNCVIELRTSHAPHELLKIAQRIEADARRVRTVKNGPRTLDVDILLYDDRTVDMPDLVIPHPRMWERNFVLRPLADIAPDLVPEGLRDAAGDVRMVDKDWVDLPNSPA
jgi:2-amino-4-hydroxy-6-hydroxymethyldihydropteridine diphosphokinase